MCQSTEYNISYVYVYLDPRKPGHYVYGEYEFDYEPFYVGKGCNGRAYIHLTDCYIKNIKNGTNKHFTRRINKIRKETGNDPIILFYKEGLSNDAAYDIEEIMVETIGRRKIKTGPLCNLCPGGKGSRCGIKMTDNIKQSLLSYHLGKPLTEEWKQNISKSLTGRKYTEDQRKNMSKAQQKYTTEDINKMRCLRKTYLSYKEIENILNISRSTIRRYCKDIKIKPKPITEETRKKMRKYTDEQVEQVREYRKKGMTFKQISGILGIPEGTMYRYCK